MLSVLRLNWIKSLANVTGVVHILFGTYDLLNCCHLSGQVSRRSDDIHLPRYSTDSQEDIAEFMRVLRTFQAHLPLVEEPSLVEQYEYFLDYSVGSIGLLITWLTKALRNALAENATSLNVKYIQQNEYSKARRQQIQPLVEQCPHCNQRFPPFSRHSRPGYCSICHLWLGEMELNQVVNEQTDSEDFWRQLLIAPVLSNQSNQLLWQCMWFDDADDLAANTPSDFLPPIHQN